MYKFAFESLGDTERIPGTSLKTNTFTHLIHLK